MVDEDGEVMHDDEGKPMNWPKRRLNTQVVDVPIVEEVVPIEPVPPERVGDRPAVSDPTFLEWYNNDGGRNARRQKTRRPPLARNVVHDVSKRSGCRGHQI